MRAAFFRTGITLGVVLILPLTIYFVFTFYSKYLARKHIGRITQWKYYDEFIRTETPAPGDLLEFQRFHNKIIPFQVRTFFFNH